ncbi:prepilin peptidase [Guyparkeria sp.]|uniref:prepilin peptidase n=1 Tax=Guyparkeria sp. TaxID=2035736 RepID=UPI003970772E
MRSQGPVSFDWLLILVTAVLGGIGMIDDARHRRIANGLLLAALALLLPLQWLAGLGPVPADRGWAVLLAAALLAPGYLLGQLGGGDLKLGLLAGLLWGMAPVLVGVLAAGVVAAALLPLRRRRPDGRFPFAVPFLPGAILTWLSTI